MLIRDTIDELITQIISDNDIQSPERAEEVATLVLDALRDELQWGVQAALDRVVSRGLVEVVRSDVGPSQRYVVRQD